MTDSDVPTGALSDEELTALALSADPHPLLDPRAVPWSPHEVAGSLPGWYMPAATRSRGSTATKVVVGVIIASFVLINALGLCVTYGWVTVA
jgi:hypothetical protein